jgi:hypothetical protein
MKFNMKSFTLAALAIGLGIVGEFNVFGGAQQQVDQSTNVLVVAATNTYALYGDITGTYTNGSQMFAPGSTNSYTSNGVFVATAQSPAAAYIDCSKTAQAAFVVGGYFANAAASASNVTFAIYQSTDLKQWVSATNVAVSVPATSTNWASVQFNLNSGGGTVLAPYYALYQVQNPSKANVTAPAAFGATTNLINLFFKAWTKTGI